MRLLAWLGRQRARAIAALVLIAILFPSLGAILKPYVTEAVVGLLCIAFFRTDLATFYTYLRSPRIVIVATIWTTLVVPILFGTGAKLFGIDDASPAIFTGLVLQAVASPMMAAPAFAALMGLDATLILVTLVCSTALTPLSAPLLAAFFAIDLTLSPMDLGLKLLTVLAASAIIGLMARRLIGGVRTFEHRDEIDGINIIILFVFVSAVMGRVGVEFIANPLLMVGLLVLAFVVFALLLIVTYTIFLVFGSRRAFAIGMMTSQRNMGLMLAGTGGGLPELTWLYFAVAQLPIYLSPLMLHPLARVLAKDHGTSPR